MKKYGLAIALSIVFMFGLFASACGKTPQATNIPVSKYSPPHSKPGPASEKLIFSQSYVDQAPADLNADKTDLYIFSLKMSAAKALLEGKTGVKAYRSPASSVSILVNPAPAVRGGLNPFSLPEVRKAMNYLIDRNFIAQDIYGGLAVPMVSLVSPLDYEYLNVQSLLREKNISYDFEYANSLVRDAMVRAGAKLINGKWHYQGQLIRLKFVIRTEDERQAIGDSARIALEKTGFQVEAIRKTFAAAIYTVYASDPQSFEWHLYTEGWGRGGTERYDFATINQMAAPWMANLPGWQIVGFWQHQNQELDRLGKALFTGDFTSKAERDEIYRRMVGLSIDDSVRVWVATIFTTFPAKKELTGVTEDLVAGLKSVFTLREAFLPGNDTLRVNNLWVWTERSVWNPVGGFGDVYSIDIWSNLYDSPIVNHPFSGIPMPFRADYQVETAGPVGKLSISPGTVLWDAEKDTWQEVPASAKATSRVVFDYSKYFQSKWHHGKKISMADVIYGIYQGFERTYDPDKKQVEFVLSSTQKPYLDTIRGIRVLDENRLEVYLDFWHFEENYIASYASLTSLSMPWEVLAAMDKMVYEDRAAAYSQTAAARYNIPWLSLVMPSTSHAARVAREIKGFQGNQYLPENIFSLIKTEVKPDYQSVLDWFDQYKHLVISQGPFKLVRHDAGAQYAELHAFRDPGYPFKPGDWYYGKSPALEFGKINIAGQVLEVELQGPGELGLNYYYTGSAGQAEKVGPNEFRVPLKGNAQKVNLLAYSDEVALVKEKEVIIK